MKKSLLFLIVAAASAVGIWAGTSPAAKGVEVCHFDNGRKAYEQISLENWDSAEIQVEKHQYDDGGDFIVDSDGTLTPLDTSDDVCAPLGN